jgi:hypothetical protein
VILLENVTVKTVKLHFIVFLKAVKLDILLYGFCNGVLHCSCGKMFASKMEVCALSPSRGKGAITFFKNMQKILRIVI